MLKHLKPESRVLSAAFMKSPCTLEAFFGIISRGRVSFDAALSTLSSKEGIVRRAAKTVRSSSYYNEIRLVVVTGVSVEEAREFHVLTGIPTLILEEATFTPIGAFKVLNPSRIFKEYVRRGGILRLRVVRETLKELLNLLHTDTLL